MGYYFYLAKMNKHDFDDFQSCKSSQNLAEYCKRHNIECTDDTSDDNDICIPPYELTQRVYNFGKDLDCLDRLYKDAKDFYPPELKSEYEDYGAIIFTKEMFLTVIESYKQSTLEFYKHKKEIVEKNDCLDKKVIPWLKNRIDEIKTGYFIDTDVEHTNLTNSWSYEYAIFNLLYLYKNLNPNDVLIFYGC